MFEAAQIFRTYARWRRSREAYKSAAGAQRRLLMSLVQRSARTRFGVDHGFASIRDVAGFQRRTPLRSYEAHWSEYWQRDFPLLRDCTWPGLIRYFAKSSGTTTGASKYIPYTDEMGRGAAWGMIDLLCHHFFARPQSRLLGGMALILSGPEDLEALAPGVQAGAVSAITTAKARRWMRRRLLPDPRTAAIGDWQEKIRALAPLSLERSIRALGGSPNWLLLFLDEVARNRPDAHGRLAGWYPELELIVHGGINFAPYRDRFQTLLEGSRAETREVYSASEGFFAVADRGDGEGMRLQPDIGVFFEFVPVSELDAEQPTRHWIKDVDLGVDYAVVISTAAGLWAYSLGDTVRFLSRDPPRLHVTGRTNYLLSAFGEHLSEQEIADAVSAAALAIGIDVLDYVVAARMSPDGEPGGHHHYLVGCVPVPPDPAAARRFSEVLDRTLQARNEDYRELRGGDYSLRPPVIRFAPEDSLVEWMKRNRALGGQNKVPRIVHDLDLFDQIFAFVKDREATSEP